MSSKTVVEDIRLVRTKVIKLAGVGQSYEYLGEVRGRHENRLSFQINGKIIKRNIDLGSVVHPGEVLIQIDSKDIQQSVASNSISLMFWRLVRVNMRRSVSWHNRLLTNY